MENGHAKRLSSQNLFGVYQTPPHTLFKHFDPVEQWKKGLESAKGTKD